MTFRHAFNSVVDEEVRCDVFSFVVNTASCVSVSFFIGGLSINSLSCVGLTQSRRESRVFSFSHLILYTALHKRVSPEHSLAVFATISHD